MVPRVMTVASTDSGGGAGVMADLKTFTAMKVFGTAVIVSLTAQNSVTVKSIYELPVSFINDQFDAIMDDIGTDSAKTGMLYSEEIISAVTEKFQQYNVTNIVVDPVMISKTNARLLKEDAVSSMVNKLMKIATLVTPNIPESEVISSIKIHSIGDARIAAKRIYEMTGASVLVKGGHSHGDISTDILYDGSEYSEFPGARIDTRNTHGTGDTLSASIASYLASGMNLQQAISLARKYIEGAIKNSFPMGKGYGSLSHFWAIK
ncbi:MAG: bifunctional hydroxymethylpyrimidine kinase/phosphomethylpyrimidine kinase [Ferroplasma sp.]|uniref:bifunctional hydroxymethylpyrimidine kinase/phosphomethylpyrimidine kinase n=1 Tax=Ferroplasma sp. TaxID=2591003 RepID=UPI00281634E4|nr:bifunctional hydroxymethylpyrimidine kinase/phosphomethylpyrimidine kinase [Ferroplasma sp.]WMT52129.1 MAG: bifunctional hydroxymethylpyrimidine kinase/phosphomethylpyrimidine kinase [Ferroplasma sp.]